MLRHRLLRSVWMVQFACALDDTLDAEASVHPASDVVIRRATPDDDTAVQRLALGREPIAQRRARGDVALLAELHGRPVGCTFVARAPVCLDRYFLSHVPRPHEAYHYGLYVVRDARRRGIAAALSYRAADAARASGARVLTCWVDTRNGPAVALQEHLGLAPQARMLLCVIANRLSVRWTVRTSASPS